MLIRKGYGFDLQELVTASILCQISGLFWLAFWMYNLYSTFRLCIVILPLTLLRLKRVSLGSMNCKDLESG